MTVYIDADACPVIDITVNIAKRFSVAVVLLCDTNHIFSSDYATVKTVGAGKDAVDYVLVNLCAKGDVVVTQDYGLAAMAIGKGAYAVNQSGFLYTDENIEQLLHQRYMSSKARRTSSKNHLKGPKKRTSEDDKKFETVFENLIKQLCKIS